MTESPTAWTRFRRHFDLWLDGVDVLLYGGLGLALLAYALYAITRALLAAGHEEGVAAVALVVAVSAASLVRDLRRGRFSPLSKGFAGLWALCVAIVIAVELIASFR